MRTILSHPAPFFAGIAVTLALAAVSFAVAVPLLPLQLPQSAAIATLGQPPVLRGSMASAETRDPGCACSGKTQRPQRPRFAEATPDAANVALDQSDEIAALSSLQHALATVADGSTYVWQRQNGRLSGLVKPTGSFRNADGAICRQLLVLMTTGEKTRKIEGVACRGQGGVWRLEG